MIKLNRMKNWQIIKESKDAQKITVNDIINILLENRGIITEGEINTFLNPQLEYITIDSAGIDKKAIQKSLRRIDTAISKKEQVVIYGDYDVDGITASAIIWETLHAIKANVTPYIPHRVEEGYGLSSKGISNVKSQIPNVKLIITVDNGIVAKEAVDFANKQGIDVIITDHHTLGSALPDAYAIVHTTKLCGAGIAWLFAKEIKKPKIAASSRQAGAPRNGNKAEDEHLELAALGTIADLVPLVGANRAIVKNGLKKLSSTKRIGLKELFKEAGCDAANIGAYEVGHIIAPRLNAAGRMSSAMDSLRLLCTNNQQRAKDLAALLGSKNKERQNIMLEAVKHASLSVHARQELKKLLIVSHETYPEGIIGLVAGRLVEEFYRPSIVIARGEKLSKGSVRSISGFNIIEFLRQSSDFFVNIGGHPMAAGFTIETEKIGKMTEALEKFAHEAVDDSLFNRTIKIDCEIPLYIITNNFYSALHKLEPFGMGNPEPTFVSNNLKIKDVRILGKDGKHLRLTVSQENTIFNAIAFGLGELAKELNIGDLISLAYTITENRWNGNRKLELKVKDIDINT
jgi:single-stranded-DNA-specific exonuclease